MPVVSLMENLNTTANGTHPQNCYSPIHPQAEKVGKTFACCLFLVISLAGNTLVAIIIYKTKSMRTTTNYFILNMAMSDLLLPILVFPSILIEMYGGFWFSGEQGQTFCKVVLFIQYVSCFVSIENLVLIAVDRFGAVVFPLRPPLIGSRLCPFFILSTWVAASALSSPIFFGVKSVKFTGKFQSCEWVWKQSFFLDNYLHALPFVFVTVSFNITIILYSIILFKLKSQKTPGEQSVNAVKRREKRQRNVLRMAVAIVTGFFLCWGPSNLIALLTVFVWDNTTCEIANYWLITLLMAYANCAVNPCICFGFSGKYRQGLKGLLGCH